MRTGDVARAPSAASRAAAPQPSGRDDRGVAAALAYDDANWRAALHGGVADQLLRDALPWPATSPPRCGVAGGAQPGLAFTGRGDEARALADRAVVAARELGDHAAVRVAMSSVLFVPWTAETIDHQVAIARELLERTEAAGDIEWLSGAHNKLFYGLVTLGELDEARDVARRFREINALTGQPLFSVLVRQAQALLAMGGGGSPSRVVGRGANALSSYLSARTAEGGYGGQIFHDPGEQGRLDAARPWVEAVARMGAGGETWRPALTVLYAELACSTTPAAS